MSERSCITQSKEPIKRNKNLSRHQECLKYPGYQCNCVMSDEIVRTRTLKKLRQELGFYSFFNLLDDRLAQMYENRRKQLCEGTPPKLIDRIKDFVRIRIV